MTHKATELDIVKRLARITTTNVDKNFVQSGTDAQNQYKVWIVHIFSYGTITLIKKKQNKKNIPYFPDYKTLLFSCALKLVAFKPVQCIYGFLQLESCI